MTEKQLLEKLFGKLAPELVAKLKASGLARRDQATALVALGPG